MVALLGFFVFGLATYGLARRKGRAKIKYFFLRFFALWIGLALVAFLSDQRRRDKRVARAAHNGTYALPVRRDLWVG